MGDKPRQVIVTGFGDMKLIAEPGKIAFSAIVRFQIIRRANSDGSWRKLLL
jgi:hypothetical protein